MYCLDSCICIDFLRGKAPDFYRLLKQTDPRLVKVPAIVQAELLLGVAKSGNPQRGTVAVEEFLLPFEVLPFNDSCSYEYAKLRCDLEKAGIRIGGNDMLIAATALANNATLVTSNVREFKRIDSLRVESWDAVGL